MDEVKFIELNKDSKVIKFGGCQGQYFIYQDIVIGFFFIHQGYPNHFFSYPEKRVYLSAFNKMKLKVDIPLIKIEEKILIMVNSHNSDYAMTFQLSIDPYQQLVNVSLVDKPKLGHTLITPEERSGIDLNY